MPTLARRGIAALSLAACVLGCGPARPPDGAYSSAPDLLADLQQRRAAVWSFRITGRVDHFGEEHRVQGKLFLFAEQPGRLRVDLLSPFGSTLSLLTVDGERFALSDVREGRYLEGPAAPCNIARLIRVPLPPDQVIRALIGDPPLIEGTAEVRWQPDGYYRVEIVDGARRQVLDVDPDEALLPVRRARLFDADELVFDMRYERWRRVGDRGIGVPHEVPSGLVART